MNRGYAHFASIAFCAVLFIAGQHGAKAADTSFDDTAIPDSVMASMNAARADKPLWMPKFKKISYTVKATLKRKDSEASIEQESRTEISALPNGLLDIRETYSSNLSTFDVQRTMLGNFINLKSRLNRLSDGRILVATKLNLELPAELTLDAKIVSEGEAEFRPLQAGDLKRHIVWQCVVKERVDANTIFPKLTGKAAKLDCQGSPSAAIEIYFEDLGFFFMQEDRLSSVPVSGHYAITRMDIER